MDGPADQPTAHGMRPAVEAQPTTDFTWLILCSERTPDAQRAAIEETAEKLDVDTRIECV